MWRQRARVEWLSAGDKSMKFFHLRVDLRHKKNMIKALQNSLGVEISDPAELKVLANDFYKSLYLSERVQNMYAVLNHVPRNVTVEMNSNLCAPYTKEEVKIALFQMFPTKAPGLDGFPAHFYQKHWEICGNEVTNIVIRIVNGEESPAAINENVLVLIPKKTNPTVLAQFRPIILFNVLYKIASKVIANRLKIILPDIISKE